MSTIQEKVRMDIVDDYYALLEELAGESLDGLITEHAYCVRRMQLRDLYANERISEREIDLARIRRYG